MGLIGLCKKAGALVLGFDAVVEKVKERKQGLVLFTSDFSLKSLVRIKEKLINFDVRFIILKDVTMDDLCSILNKRTGVVLVVDTGFVSSFKKLFVLER